jgi:Zn-dependent peptidase ImmA (M78 family)
MPETSAEKIILQREIATPEEINLEAIALTLGAQVKRRPLTGCEARILGKDKKAIITININSIEERQRFSIGHELGHWQCHRGESFQCSKDDIGSFKNTSKQKEREADAFAADLLMPWFLFKPIARSFPNADFNTAFKIMERFKTSLSTTAIRLVESNIFPAIVICHDQSSRRWFQRSDDIPNRWFPKKNLTPESSAFDIVYGKAESDIEQMKVSASAWFDSKESERYELLEQSISYGSGMSLTILEFFEVDMLEEHEKTEQPRGLDALKWK